MLILSLSWLRNGSREEITLVVQSKNSFDSKEVKVDSLVVGRARVHSHLFLTEAGNPMVIHFFNKTNPPFACRILILTVLSHPSITVPLKH